MSDGTRHNAHTHTHTQNIHKKRAREREFADQIKCSQSHDADIFTTDQLTVSTI